MKNKLYRIPYEINNLCDLLKKAVETYENKTYAEQFVNGSRQKFSFIELKRDIGIVGNYFLKHKLSDSYILLSGNLSYEWIVTFFAVQFVRSKAVCIDKNILTRDDFSHVISGIDISFNITDGKIDRPDSITFSDIRNILNDDLSDCDFNYDIEINDSANEIAVVLFTSGTTNIEKQVYLTHKNLADNIMGSEKLVGAHSYDRMLSFLPVHHAFELTVGVLTTIYIGMTVCIPRGLKYAMKDILEFSPTLIPAVPLIMKTIMKNIKSEVKRKKKERMFNFLLKAEGIPLISKMFRRLLYNTVVPSLGGKLKIFVCGGASADDEMQIFFKKLGFRMCMGYGITECSPVICCGDKITGSVGPAMPYCKIKVIDGELCVKGSIVAKQLAPDINDHMEFYDDWYRTGDLGHIDKNGNVFITGRKKELIILDNGENVSPTQLETILDNLEGVEETMAFAYSMPNRSSVLAVAIKPVKEWEGKPNQELIDNYRQQISALKLPNQFKIEKMIIFRDDFLHTSSRKIKRTDSIKLIEKRCCINE